MNVEGKRGGMGERAAGALRGNGKLPGLGVGRGAKENGDSGTGTDRDGSGRIAGDSCRQTGKRDTDNGRKTVFGIHANVDGIAGAALGEINRRRRNGDGEIGLRWWRLDPTSASTASATCCCGEQDSREKGLEAAAASAHRETPGRGRAVRAKSPAGGCRTGPR